MHRNNPVSVHTASLPMYDFPEIALVHDQWWTGISAHLKQQGVTDVPEILMHGQPVRTLWDDPGLFLSQCCGYDVVHRYRASFSILLTPHYVAPGCSGPCYSSRVLVHEDSRFDTLESLRGAVAVINGPESQSGMNGLLFLINPLQQGGHFFSRIQVSGAHVSSLAALQQHRADVAAIDCVTHALLARYRPAAIKGLRQIGWTASVPGLPYVTLAACTREQQAAMRRALTAAFIDPALKPVRDALLIGGFSLLETQDYRVIGEQQVFDRRLLAVMA